MKFEYPDKSITLYKPVLRFGASEFFEPETEFHTVCGESMQELCQNIISGQYEDVVACYVSWGPNAGHDITSGVRDKCLDLFFSENLELDDEFEINEFVPSFIEEHDNFQERFEEYVLNAKEELRHIKSESMY